MKYREFAAMSALLFALDAAAASAQMMKPPASISAQAFDQARTGQSVQLAVRVTKIARSKVWAELLDARSDGTYDPTGKIVLLTCPDGTPFVMGTPADLVRGAVLFVYAVATKPDRADAKKIVVVTKFATIHSG